VPEVRTFLKSEGHADTYEDLEVTWVHGVSPTLYLYEGEEFIEEVALKDFKTNEIHKLLSAKGFNRKTVEDEVNVTSIDGDEF
jgi:hypothetical protein